ncbi:MAG: hypothetical protein WCP18_03525 [bacterium]
MSKTTSKAWGKKGVYGSLRLPLPPKVGGPQTTKHGERGYDRKNAKRNLKQELANG